MTKRAIFSCDLCRARKVRCDKNDPCHGCQMRGVPCERMDAEAQEAILRQQAAHRQAIHGELQRRPSDTLTISGSSTLQAMSDMDDSSASEMSSVVASAPPAFLMQARLESLQTVNKALGAALGLTPPQLAMLVSVEEERLLKSTTIAVANQSSSLAASFPSPNSGLPSPASSLESAMPRESVMPQHEGAPSWPDDQMAEEISKDTDPMLAPMLPVDSYNSVHSTTEYL